MIEKNGVVLDKEKVEETKKTGTCPRCGSSIVTPPCNSCGTKPFEKKPDTAKDTGLKYPSGE